ncbi:MAG: hypothetical protein LW832_00345 [Parachlamydia sp.]|nr:hypothetical protein [Parachlamydia sp.]
MIAVSNPIPVRNDSLFNTHFRPLDRLSEIILNIITIGIGGSIKLVGHENAIKKLKWQQQTLQTKAAEALRAWDNIEKNLEGIIGSLSTDGEIAGQVGDLRFLLNNLKLQIEHLHSQLNGRNYYDYNRLGQHLLVFLKHLLANLATLGIYSVVKNYHLEKEIARLQHQNGEIRATYHEKFVTAKFDQMNQEIDDFEKVLKQVKKLEKLKNLTAEDTQQESQQIKEQIISLRAESQQLKEEEAAVKSANEHLSNEVKGIREELIDLRGRREALRDKFRTYVGNQLNDNQEVLTLRNKAGDYQFILEEIKTTSQKIVILKRKLQKFNQLNSDWPTYIANQAKLGPLPSPYERRRPTVEISENVDEFDDYDQPMLDEKPVEENVDVAIEGAPGINSELDAGTSDYALRYNGEKTALGVVRKGLHFAITDLAANPKMHLNQSALILNDPAYQRHKQAIFRRLVWDFIENGALVEEGCGDDFSLKLNVDDVKMGRSQPEKVLTYVNDQSSNSFRLEVKTVPTHFDAFTPNEELAVDPASAKWIHAQLTDIEKNILFHLLMEPLISNEDPELIAAIQCLEEDNERVKLISTAYQLINDIASALDSNFRSPGLLDDVWNYFDDANERPFQKTLPLCLFIESFEKNVEWNFDPAIIANGNPESEFLNDFLDANLHYASIFENMSKEVVLEPQNESERSLCLNQQYYISKGYPLFKTLLISLMSSEASITSENITHLKGAIATFLFENQQQFVEKIEQKHGISIYQYLSWLREADDFDIQPGELEIELAAWTFGIRFALMGFGKCKINQYGLNIPASYECYFGPRTKECMLLYQDKNSYCGLWPRLKRGILNGAAERANLSISTYKNNI